MRIALVTSGRFHVCDLARELDRLGHEVAFYSLVPPRRTAAFGLPKRCNRWLLPWVAPAYAAVRAAQGTRAESLANRAFAAALDATAARLVERCDVLVGMSGMVTATAEAVKRRYGAKVLVERGSRHILSQRQILDALRPPGAPSSVPEWGVKRELADYEVADLIVVPSRHVVESFKEFGVAEDRLFRNPFGVDLTMFPATPRPPDSEAVVLNVGSWSLRKGCEVLAKACERAPSLRLEHVGPVVDAPLPGGEWFHHHPPVNQHDLSAHYARGRVFAIASREEGLALVQPQALASGLRLVCTTRTGGEDLRDFLDDPELVSVVPPDDVGALRAAIDQAIEASRSDPDPRELLGGARDKLSWAAYAERYDRRLRDL